MTTCSRCWALRCAAVWLLLYEAHTAPVSGAERMGEVQFSDGEILRGTVSMTAGTTLRIHAGNDLRTVALGAVREIRLEPEKEAMERKWRFVEAGRTEKKFWGEPFPVRHIRTTLLLGNGQAMSGHLYTTVLYVENDAGTRKVVLRAKLRGSQGQGFDDLLHPVCVRFDGEPAASPGDVTLALPEAGGKGPAEVAVLTRHSLLRLAARPGELPGEFVVPSALGTGVFVAVRRPGEMQVSWPATNDAQLVQRVDAAQRDARDFFDVRDMLGVHREGDDIYSLLMLRREGQTTLGTPASQPWRLGIWRWREASDGRLMVAGRGYFFRGIIPKGKRPPAAASSPGLWQLAQRMGTDRKGQP